MSYQRRTLKVVYDTATRSEALAALDSGASLRTVSRATGIARATLREWRDRPAESVASRHPAGRFCCFRCEEDDVPHARAYLYLLGLYLGDGCISAAARTTALRIACADDYPGIKNECEAAITVISGRPTYRVRSEGCTTLTALWRHWPCLFPQHGPGRKHTRPIEFADWQQQLLRADPQPLIRGLIQSDGCRVTNTVVPRRGRGNETSYSYPRYFFSNESADILRIYTDALDLLGIAWRQNRRNSISVARREAVAALDAFVGPKG